MARLSTKGLSSYDIYLRQRQALENKGYVLEDAMSKKDFDFNYQLIKTRAAETLDPKTGKPAKAQNIVRTLSRDDIVLTHRKESKLEKDILTGAKPEFIPYWNPEKQMVDFGGKSRKAIYDAMVQAYGDDVKEYFYRGHGIY